ncbi:flavin reductase family protein [Planomonospora sp. ID91781]|uniref:Flavin reductase n=1 Tax=Planomonospora sphaerica TaxID=161355 RepID=A0A171CSR7_9ACTN|nr:MULTISPECIES: flavin reductase family protein [Planomonospora]MBG0823465.1 flavin reductase family protein [Planomonospora sp. ID91781]GAT67159.1 flavin reductase [Planomonospora sphaerica]
MNVEVTSPPAVDRPSPPAVDRDEMRRACGAFATGVTVVTTGGDAVHGMTANSFTSVSLDPPLLLVCIGRDAVMHRRLGESAHFGVSVLAGHQEGVARYFAHRWRKLGAAQFEAVDWTPGRLTGVPLIEGALAHFECEVRYVYGGGDHTIFVGGVLALERHPGADALVFADGRFRTLDGGRMTA